MRNTDLIPEIANDMTPRKVKDSQTETHAIVHPTTRTRSTTPSGAT